MELASTVAVPRAMDHLGEMDVANVGKKVPPAVGVADL